MSEKQYIERYWRDAKPEDAIKEPPMDARFMDFDCDDWQISNLMGFTRTVDWCPPLFSKGDETFNKCQVYDAPDPGEGWRLIDTDKDDYDQDGIDFWYPDSKKWCSRSSVGRDRQPFTVNDSVYYRIRIEPPKPKYVPFTWEDREQLRGRWIYRDNQELQLVNFDNSDGLRVNNVHVENLCKYWKFLDTGKSVGKEVTQ